MKKRHSQIKKKCEDNLLSEELFKKIVLQEGLQTEGNYKSGKYERAKMKTETL